MHILHLVNTFLPVTQNWIYSQIRFNSRSRASVLCQYRENETQFPHDAVYCMYPRLTLFARADMLFSRLRGRYRRSISQHSIREVKPDIAHGHIATESWRHLDGIRSAGIPLVTTFYGVDVNKVTRRNVWRKRYAALFSYGAAFICEGPFMQKEIEKLGCPREKTTCIPLGVDIEAIRNEPPPAPDGRLHVLFVGLGREKKGNSDAACAFAGVAARDPKLHFDIVGDGAYRPVVGRILGQAGLLDRCTFHGIVPVSRYRSLLKTAVVALAPSITAADGDTEGGAPVTVIEAQAAGVPVVGTTHCDIPFIVKQGETGLLSPERDVAALSANLRKLIEDPGLRNTMGAAAVIHATRQHDIKKQVEKIQQVYEKAAKTDRSSRNGYFANGRNT